MDTLGEDWRSDDYGANKKKVMQLGNRKSNIKKCIPISLQPSECRERNS